MWGGKKGEFRDLTSTNTESSRGGLFTVISLTFVKSLVCFPLMVLSRQH